MKSQWCLFYSFEHLPRMGTSGAIKIPLGNDDVPEETETTVEIKIRTLDSQTYTLRVNKCVPVPALKEQIATVTGVLSEQQRLICRGRVLKDDQLLSAYHVEDGHTLHLVVRQPHQSSTFIGPEGQSGNSAPDSLPNHSGQVSRTVVLEAVNIDQADLDPTFLNRIMTSILNSFGATNNGINTVNSVSTNNQEASSERFSSSFGDAGVSSGQNQPYVNFQRSQNQLNISSQRMEFDRHQASFQFPTGVPSGSQNLPAIPHSLTTLQQYLAHLKNVFSRDILGSNDSDHNSRGVNHTDNGDYSSSSHDSSRRDDLPTPTALAEILQSTRQLIGEHVEERLLRLARELENDANITCREMRSNVQSRAFRTGYFLQNLGSLLLELGRTTMTLRMGQIPAEAVVNAGPAVFISASGPNPVMVQPVPFYPAPSFRGVDMVSSNSSHGPEGERVASAVFPRNIDIRIHAVPIPAANQSGLEGAQLQHENSDSTRTSADNDSAHQPVQAHPRSGTLTGEFGLRVVPVRTVVAMPAGISNSQSNLPGILTPLLHPLISRIRQQNSGPAINVLGPQAFSFHQGGVEANQASMPDSVRQIIESYIGDSVPETQGVPSFTVPVVSGQSVPPTAQIEHQGTHVYITSQQMPNTYNESSRANDGEESLPQYLNISNQTSSTVVVGEQVNVGGVDQQVSALSSCTEQISNEMDESNETSASVNDQGVLFSSYLHQLMPLLTQGSISHDVSNADANSLTLEAHRVDLNDPSSSQHKRDPIEPPSSKRHKKE